VKAIVLCGGLGTRLGELTREVPKPLLDVGGRPFMHYVLDRLAAAGIVDVTLATSFQSGMFAGLYGDRWCGIRIRHSVEQEPLGTGGAVRQAMAVAQADEALVLNGDTLFEMSIEAFIAFQRARQAQVAVAVRRVADASRYGSVHKARDGRVVRFGEKSEHGDGLVNAGIYIIQASAFDEVKALRFSLENDLLAIGSERLSMYAFEAEGYFVDIGIPEDLDRARRDLSAPRRT
jgi:D-glycero-alpha-D-manno-heptose 1-phosphate guanylyltransferase